MTNNTNEPNDVDIDTQEDFDKEPQQRASLKDTWDNNPMLKIAAVVVVGATLIGAYLLFSPTESKIQNSRVSQVSGVKGTPGNDGLDEEYKTAIEGENERVAKEAAQRGGSAMPIPIGKPQDDALTLPPAAKQEAGDPLQEWRAKAEARRLSLENEAAPPEEEVQAPEIVPMVQPIRPQPTMKLDPQAAKMLTQQMQAIIATQAPKPASRLKITKVTSLWQRKKLADKEALEKQKKLTAPGAVSGGAAGAAGAGGAGAVAASGKAATAAKAELIVPAGNIAYAQLLNDLNSDIPGPALAQIMSGPFEGGRAIGQFTKVEEYLTLNFKRVMKDGVSYSINTMAINEETSLSALSSDVDHHYFKRIILPMAAQFLTGYTSAAAQTGQTTVAANGAVGTDIPPPDPKQQLMQGATQAANTLSGIITEDSGRPITVYLNRGTTMGLLFLDSVTTGNADK